MAQLFRAIRIRKHGKFWFTVYTRISTLYRGPGRHTPDLRRERTVVSVQNDNSGSYPLPLTQPPPTRRQSELYNPTAPAVVVQRVCRVMFMTTSGIDTAVFDHFFCRPIDVPVFQSPNRPWNVSCRIFQSFKLLFLERAHETLSECTPYTG